MTSDMWLNNTENVFLNYHCDSRVISTLPPLVYWQTALNRRTVQPFTESDDTRCCNNTIDLLKTSMVMLETCRGL